MAQSLSKIYIHLIFHIKTISSPIRESDLDRIHSYIGQLVNATGCKVIQVGGMCDHVHILFLLSKDVAISHVVEEVKRNSSRWMKTIEPYYSTFAWQNGYGVFSVSQSVVGKTLEYVKNQGIHHKKMSFQDEYQKFLESYGVEYNKYLRINAFALSGRQCYGKFITQGVASLALGYVLMGFQPVHYRLHLNNSSKFDCIRFAR